MEGFYVDHFQPSSVHVVDEDFSLDFFKRFLIFVFLFPNECEEDAIYSVENCLW